MNPSHSPNLLELLCQSRVQIRHGIPKLSSARTVRPLRLWAPPVLTVVADKEEVDKAYKKYLEGVQKDKEKQIREREQATKDKGK